MTASILRLGLVVTVVAGLLTGHYRFRIHPIDPAAADATIDLDVVALKRR